MSFKEKVIIVGPAFPLRGGIANFNEALCREMVNEGVDVQLISFSLQYPGFLFPGKTQFDQGEKPKDISIHTKINSVNPFNWIKVARYIKSQRPGLVIIRYWLPFMGPCLGTIAKIIKRSTSIKVIAITDNVIPHEKRAGDNILTRYFIRQCDGFIAMSKAVLQELSIFTSTDKKVFLPHPIYNIFGNKVEKTISKQELKLDPSANYLLFFGFIRQYKGLDLILQAMADKRIKKLGIKLLVAGEYYEDPAPYEKIIQENELTDAIILHTHYIASDMVKYYFCAADMIVQPYRSATQSGVTQIAYNFERPMLVTNTGGLPEIVPHGKVGYVTAIDAFAIADSIVDFYSNKREQQFAENTVAEKQRFLWSSFVKGVHDLYFQLNPSQNESSHST